MRNTLCQRYSKCLDVSARRNRLFDCGRCRLRRSAPPDFERRFSLWHDLDGCRLLAAVFFPGLYERYRQLCSGARTDASAADAAPPEKGAGDHTGRGEIVPPCASP